MKNKYHLIIIIATLVFAFSFILFRAFSISQFEQSKRRNFMRGDAYSDINLYSAVQYFNDSGLAKTKGLPVHHYKVPVHDTTLHPVVYTHYPALPDLLTYFYSRIIGSISEFGLRCFVILVSLFYAYVLWQVLWRIIKNKDIVLVSWVMLILSNYFIGWSDSLHKHVYEEFGKALFILVLLRHLETPKNIYLVGLFLIMCFVANISFEPLVYLAIVCIGVSLWEKKGLFSQYTLIPAMGAIVGVVLHLWQNISYFGSWEMALADLTETAKLRTAGIEVSGLQKKLESPFGWVEFISLPFIWLSRTERFFVVPAFAIMAMWIVVRTEFKTLLTPRYYQWAKLLLIASYSWCIVMAQHAYVHSFTMRQAGLCYALIGGPIVYLFYNKITTQFKNFNLGYKVFSILIIGYTLAMFLTQAVWDMWIKNTFMAP